MTAPKIDMLEAIFMGQWNLIGRYHDVERENGCVVINPQNFGQLDQRDVQMRLKDLSQRTVEELMEAMHMLRNRPWKTSFATTNSDEFREELIDALHFFVELLITAGMTAQDVHDVYFQKNAVNQTRLEGTY